MPTYLRLLETAENRMRSWLRIFGSAVGSLVLLLLISAGSQAKEQKSSALLEKPLSPISTSSSTLEKELLEDELPMILGRSGSPQIRITYPAPNEDVQGAVTFRTEAQNLPEGCTVRYRINGAAVSEPNALYSYTNYSNSTLWHSTEVYDGPKNLVADVELAGEVIASSAVVPFNVRNKPDFIQMRLVQPASDLPLSGTATAWVVEAKVLTPESIVVALFSIDGECVNDSSVTIDAPVTVEGITTQRASMILDTTRWADGPHQMHVSLWRSVIPVGDVEYPPLGELQSVVEFRNGHTLQAIRPRWAKLYLRPQEQRNLELRAIYTHGLEETWLGLGAGFFESSNPAVATVSGDGTVTAGDPGYALITFEIAGRRGTAEVVVSNIQGFPHFSKTGQILMTYGPQSIFMRTGFYLYGQLLDTTPGLAQHVHAAAFNTLTEGLFPYGNAVYSGHTTLADWSRDFDSGWNQSVAACERYGMSMYLIGDDVCRTAPELAYSIGDLPGFGPLAVQYALTRARDSRQVLGISMVDEIGFSYGTTPIPNDNRWMNRNPPLRDDSFIRLMRNIDTVSNRPNITWPDQHVSTFRNWQQRPFADHGDIYWDYQAWRFVYSTGASLPQLCQEMSKFTKIRFDMLPHDFPAIGLTSLCTHMYTKLGPGDRYTPGQDRIDVHGARPKQTAALAMALAFQGAAGFRCYAMDTPLWADSRRDSPVGRSGLQQGANPWFNTHVWQETVTAQNFTKLLEPFLLQQEVAPLDLGHLMITGARSGAAGNLFMALNLSEMSRRVFLDLSPYIIPRGGATEIVLIRVEGSRMTTEITTDLELVQTPTLIGPGEGIACLVYPMGSNLPPAIKIGSLADGTNFSGAVEILTKAHDPDGTIRAVEFYVDGRLMATDTEAPYSYVWDTTSAQIEKGIHHSLTVVAVDDQGARSEARVAVVPVNRSL